MARFSLRNLFGGRQKNNAVPQTKHIIWSIADPEDTKLSAFENSNITYSGDLASVDYQAILRNKQANINTFYQLADYYTDADAIVHGIIKHVYVPFSVGDWYLTCDNEKTIKIFEEQYAKMRLRESINDIFTQYYKYNNVFCYIWNGNIITLAPHKCRIGNIAWNGTPLVDYNVESITTEFQQKIYSVRKDGRIDDNVLEHVLRGYPPEVAKALKERKQYATLNPDNTYVFQGSKEGWMRYAVPWIASALPALAKKELIQKYEAAQLNIGARSFVEVRYGDDKMQYEMLPDKTQINEIKNNYKNGMSGYPLVVVPYLCQSKVTQADMSDLYQWPLYEQVNADILSAGGVAGIIVSGSGEEGSTFASAQVSVQSAASRIEAARREFEDFMYKVNIRLIEDIKLIHTNNLKDVPVFHFKPLSMSGMKELREACEKLWQNGLVSSKTYLEMQGYSLAKEKKQRELEASDGTDETMISHINVPTIDVPTEDSKTGRPSKTDEERNSDPDNSTTSKQTKDAKNGEPVDTE